MKELAVFQPKRKYKPQIQGEILPHRNIWSEIDNDTQHPLLPLLYMDRALGTYKCICTYAKKAGE